MSSKQKKHSAEPDDYLEIAEKVRTGEYFREARSIYDLGVHDPMAERYMYVFITALALIIFLITLKAMQDLYPLDTSVPIIVSAEDNGDDITHIRPLMHSKAENPGEMLLGFLVSHYVTTREEYDIATFDRDASGVKSQSSDAVQKEYIALIDPVNPESPIALYQRHSKRKISIVSVRIVPEGAEVVFEAAVESRTDIKKSRWIANISFQYSGLELDQNTGEPKPLGFVVTAYHSKRLQDVK